MFGTVPSNCFKTSKYILGYGIGAENFPYITNVKENYALYVVPTWRVECPNLLLSVRKRFTESIRVLCF